MSAEAKRWERFSYIMDYKFTSDGKNTFGFKHSSSFHVQDLTRISSLYFQSQKIMLASLYYSVRSEARDEQMKSCSLFWLVIPEKKVWCHSINIVFYCFFLGNEDTSDCKLPAVWRCIPVIIVYVPKMQRSLFQRSIFHACTMSYLGTPNLHFREQQRIARKVTDQESVV